MIINVHEAKTNFSQLLRRVGKGEEIVIAKAGKPVARLVPIASLAGKRVPGSAKDEVKVARDFDDPLPGEIQKEFE